ncbi:glutathione synthetase ATP-binding domain-like protein [Mollisia scopiformis]|uniref:Glutathione synthetase ATP-binding domain-like protein n=1 Tax=Mollisia scopiformis TaxID=149040 RepID=A0A132B9P3_MOLSC|nr:glutathione synthetase ATP-binding domain-like protein [Mollisia scopiformis]KUJ09126.1 glutathione synthetase ATP-binding domain-like protein [Mollisia scopiformis]
MRSLGLKHLARERAKDAGVPLLPGTGLLGDVNQVLDEADVIGYPVIVKSSAGGGGYLALSIFKDKRVFIEKFVENVRHVEVQIVGDGDGLCPEGANFGIFVPEKIRGSMRRAAIELASSVSYRGVGTVEFLYDIGTKAFYFMEVNTRLQVEHAVTETITGLDLVEAIIRIGAGTSSCLFTDSSEHFSIEVVAVEARIYGESPLQDFEPSPGQLLEVSFPEDVRVDTWIEAGTIVSSLYNPLLAKVTVCGKDRPEAIRKLAAALQNTVFSDIETNLDYLTQIVSSSDFQNGTYTTTTLDAFKFQADAFEVLDPGPSTTI